MNTFIKTIVSLFILFYSTSVFAQVTQEQLQGQLRANGINLSPAELKQATKVAEGLDAEKQAAENKAKQAQQQAENAKEQAVQIKESVKDKVDGAEKKAEQSIKADIQQNVQEGVAAGKTTKEALADAVIEAKNEKPLPPSLIYGHHLYRQRNITAISDGVNMKAPDSYVLGVGDEISVNVWGRAEFSGSQKINEDGYVKFFQMPRLYLKGVTYKQAQSKIEGQFKQSYNLATSQIAVSLNYSRTITVNVVGEVMAPRSYTISAINTAVNALAAADGPTNIGSVRNIRVSSAGKPDRILDLYKFLLNPLSSEEFFITNNDYIYVPPVGKVVNLQGAVNRPFKYELLATENLKALLQWAGGLSPNAFKGNLQLRRFENDQIKILTINLNDLEKTGSDFELKQGDILIIPSIDGGYEEIFKTVTIQGAVKKPNTYNLLMNEGLRVLIGRSEYFKDNARRENIQVRRFENSQTKVFTVNFKDLEKTDSDFPLVTGDILVVPTIDGDYAETSKTVTIQGAVKNPNTYSLLMNEGLRVLIGKAGGLAINTYTGNFQVKRIENNEMKLYDVSLKALDSLKTDFPLIKGDVVTMNAIDADYYTNFADISGAVKMPGRYQVEKGKTKLTDFLAKAELKDDANTPLIYISRVQTDLSRIYYRVNLSEVLKNPKSADNLTLQSKDEIFILSKSNFRDAFSISITGAVRNPGPQTLATNTTFRDVLFRAGGLTLDADRTRIEISRIQNISGQLTKAVISTITIPITDTLYIKDDAIGGIQLQPFDQIAVRKIPGYDLLDNITLNGEVKYPGVYTITNKKERLSDVIKRAGGLTEAAEASDATLVRPLESVGFVVLDLDKALKQKSSKYNYIIKQGDIITIPRARELVSVEGAVDYPEIDVVKRISMAYRPGANLAYYIDEYAGGISKEKRGRYYLTQVRYPNGSVRKTKSYFFHLIKAYPPIKSGAIITVRSQPLEKNAEGKEVEKKKVDWEDVAAKSLGALTSVFTLILLTQTISGTSSR